MIHPRQAIRERVVARLTDAIPAVGGRVFKTRIYPLQRAGLHNAGDLPGICVYTLREPNDEIDDDGTLERGLELAIDIYSRGGDAIDDALDALCLAVETLMASERTFDGASSWNSLEETIFGYDGEGERANGLARLRYRLPYID